MAVTYLRLFPATQQFELRNGQLNVAGRLNVFFEGTDDLADIYDENGTQLAQPVILDDNGRASGLFVDSKKVYRLEVYDMYGELLYTVRKMVPSGGGTGSALGKTYEVISNDGSILVDKFDEGGTTTFDLSLGIDANELKPSCLRASSAPLTTDGQFVFEQLSREGTLLSVDGQGKVRMEPAWYHFTAIVELSYDGTPVNEEHQVTLWTTLSDSVIGLDTSYAHRESIELSGDIHVSGSNTEFPLGVSGLDTGITASLMSFDIHAVTGHEGNNEYHAGEGINIVNATKTISVDFDDVQEKLVAGENISITGNVISAEKEQSDWAVDDSSSPAYIKNKPNMDQYATQTQLATKQDTISDLAQIRAGAAAGSSAVQPADLAMVATTGSYNDLNNRPNLDQYATKTEVNTGLAGKQDVISDLATIRSGAAAGATAVQPADLNSYATDAELTAGLATKQDTINDLSSIRSGAAAGSTAVQPADLAVVATSGDYDDLSNKPTIPTKTSDLTNDSGFITSADAPVKDVQVEGVSVVNAQGIAEISIPATGVLDVEVDGTSVVNAQGTAEIDLSGYATTQALTSGLAGKQDTISDLATIRSGASAGASAVQPGDLATVATTGDYDDLSNKPSIPTVDQTYNASSTNAQSGVAVAQAIASVPGASYTAGDAIDITNNEISVDYDSNTLELGSQQPVTHTYNVGTYNAGAVNTTCGEVPADIRSVLTQETVTVHIPANTFYTYYIGTGLNATLLFKANNNDYPQDANVAYCPTPLTYTFEQATSKYWLDEQDVTVTTLTGSASARNYFTFGFRGEYVMNDVWTTDGLVNPIVFSYTSAAGTGSLTVKNPLPASSVSDANKVLTVNAQGVPGWATSAPGGVTDVEVDGTSVVSGGVASITMPTVDQTYNASSANAQSGVAMAGALATKQDTISDLAAIRSGAAEGATAVQPGDLATVATTGSYNSLSDQPTIPSGVELVPAATSADEDKVLTVDAQGIPGWAIVPSGSTGLFEAIYGQTTYAAITQAISEKKIVYCRISATGASRMAFLAYIGTSNVEFQYYRSLSSHSASNMTDEVYVYTVASSGWTTTTRKTGVKVTAGTHMSQSYSNDTLTLNAAWPDVDQTYDASSANAQSGVAVASAIAAVQTGLFEAVYGTTTYADVLQAISDNKIVYCNAPGTGDTRRMAVMTFKGANNVEFQYYRSNSSGTDSVFIYSVSSSGWTTTERSVTGRADATYNASSTVAQSGVAVAQAIGALPTSLTSTQVQSFKEALGVDETVLYENNSPSQIISDTSLTLSESYLHFEKVKLYLRASGGNTTQGSYIVESPVYQNESTEVSAVCVVNAIGSVMYDMNVFLFNTTAPTTCSAKSNGTRLNIASSGISTTANRGARIYKIVGIHRIASN